MNFIAKLVVASIGVTGSAVAGIEIAAPLISGEVATLADRHQTGRKELSQAQLQSLSHWLASHRSGWHGMVTEASSEPAALQFLLKDSNGKIGSLAVVASARGDYYLQFVSSSEKWSYQSFGGLFKTWAATRALSAEDLSQLLHAVDMPKPAAIVVKSIRR